MFCIKCGKRNPEGVQFCAYCGHKTVVPEQLLQAPSVPEVTAADVKTFAPPEAAVPPGVAPRISGLAVASLILGILGVTALVGLILGIVGLVQINASRGRLRGQGLAIAGISVSGFMVLMVLPAMLFPVFAQARAKARQTQCLSNLKQIAVATMMYVSDWDGHYPPTRNWCDTLNPYIMNTEIYRCPSLPTERGGYAYNTHMSGIREYQIVAPAQTVIQFDSTGGWNLAGGPELADLRHNNGLNMGFADGHVKWCPSAVDDWLSWSPRAGASLAPPPGGPPGPPVWEEEAPPAEEEPAPAPWPSAPPPG